MDNEMKQVNVTWKWLAVTVVGALITIGGYNQVRVDSRLDRVENRIAITPTQQDVRDLRMSIDKLSDKLDDYRISSMAPLR